MEWFLVDKDIEIGFDIVEDDSINRAKKALREIEKMNCKKTSVVIEIKQGGKNIMKGVSVVVSNDKNNEKLGGEKGDLKHTADLMKMFVTGVSKKALSGIKGENDLKNLFNLLKGFAGEEKQKGKCKNSEKVITKDKTTKNTPKPNTPRKRSGNIECTHCGSKNWVKKGCDQYGRRGLCKNCSRSFYL
ncbi:MAG: hypothetical protein BWK75_02180 [Candidatus Altiarchaeales archaeon A3]|nr:MAG: hypothetical protein BWK75_02180 [Candidatus Altiarchaeales archaeon A3]